jgi:DNA processing protein
VREQDLLLWLCTTSGVGGRSVRRLQEHFGSWQGIWQAEEFEMVQGAGIGRKQAQALCRARETFDPVVLRRSFEPSGIRFVSCIDPEYPKGFHTLYDAPAGVFVAGERLNYLIPGLAVVGSRSPTAYGKLVAEKLVSECAGHGLTIVSGLARGIDTAAHLAALRAGGRTIAVLGSGLLNIYPKENLALARRIVEGKGALVSEWHPLMPPKPGHFPIRNRLIAALAQGTLVIEAGEKSGSLITVDQALEQGRDVYAVPGPIHSQQSLGTNRLIQQGAKLVLNVEDILEDFAYSSPYVPSSARRRPLPEDKTEAELLALLGVEEMHLDQLLQATGWEAGLLHQLLLRLQLQGWIHALPGGRYVRAAL